MVKTKNNQCSAKASSIAKSMKFVKVIFMVLIFMLLAFGALFFVECINRKKEKQDSSDTIKSQGENNNVKTEGGWWNWRSPFNDRESYSNYKEFGGVGPNNNNIYYQTGTTVGNNNDKNYEISDEENQKYKDAIAKYLNTPTFDDIINGTPTFDPESPFINSENKYNEIVSYVKQNKNNLRVVIDKYNLKNFANN
jgi:hypothetical protein